MKERLINNLGLKILSIFLAFFVWLLVVNVSNPEVSRSQEVTLEIVNGQVLRDARRTYEIGRSTVMVAYDVNMMDDYKISPSDFRAYVDLAELYDVTGSVQVKVEVLHNERIIRNASAKPGVIQVSTEDLQIKPFELAVNFTGEGKPEDGYALNGISLMPTRVIVEGPVSQVGMISSAGVEINVDGLKETTEDVTSPVFYDANGNRLKLGDQVKVNLSEIRYQVNINRVKSLSLDFQVSGTVAPGYRFTGVDCNVKSVAVSGLKSNLASLNMISIPGTALNIDGAREDKTVNVDVRDYLPEGITIAPAENPILEIYLRVEQLTTRTIDLSESDISLESTDDSLNYNMTPDQVKVTLRGLKDDLESLDGAALKAFVDVSDMQAGVHGAVVKFADSEVFTVVDPPMIEIEVSPHVLIQGETSSQDPLSAEAAAGVSPENGQGNPAESQESTAENASPETQGQ